MKDDRKPGYGVHSHGGYVDGGYDSKGDFRASLEGSSAARPGRYGFRPGRPWRRSLAPLEAHLLEPQGRRPWRRCAAAGSSCKTSAQAAIAALPLGGRPLAVASAFEDYRGIFDHRGYRGDDAFGHRGYETANRTSERCVVLRLLFVRRSSLGIVVYGSVRRHGPDDGAFC